MPRTWAPTAATAVGDGYGLGAGDATVDLTSPRLIATATTANPVTVPVQLGAGKLRVLVPTGVPVKITVDLGMGHVSSRIDGRELSGNVTETVTSGTGDPTPDRRRQRRGRRRRARQPGTEPERRRPGSHLEPGRPGILFESRSDAMNGTPVRVRTVVAGLVALAISLAVIVSRLTNTHVDGGLVALLVVLATGAVMVATGILSAVRSRR